MCSAERAAASEIKAVLILGDNFPAPPIIHALAHSPRNYTVHIAHPHTPTSARSHHNATFHTTRLNPTALGPLLADISPDIVIDTTPGPFIPMKKDLIDCLLAARVPRFIPSDFGHDALNPALQARLPVCAERARTVEYLRSLKGEVQWSAAAVGVVLDRGLLGGNLGFDLAWRNAGMLGNGSERFAGSSAAWVGRVAVGMLERWEEVQGRYLYAAGVVASGDAVVKWLQRAGGKAWTVDREGDMEAVVREAERRIERGFVDAGMFLLERSVLFDGRLDAAGAFEGEDAKGMLGLAEGEDLEEMMREVVREYERDGGKAEGCGCH